MWECLLNALRHLEPGLCSLGEDRPELRVVDSGRDPGGEQYLERIDERLLVLRQCEFLRKTVFKEGWYLGLARVIKKM